jgi:hypothetical protein
MSLLFSPFVFRLLLSRHAQFAFFFTARPFFLLFCIPFFPLHLSLNAFSPFLVMICFCLGAFTKARRNSAVLLFPLCSSDMSFFCNFIPTSLSFGRSDRVQKEEGQQDA